MSRSDAILCLFSAQIESDGESYHLSVPEREFNNDTLEADGIYRVAVLPAIASSDRGRSGSYRAEDSQSTEPPVQKGDTLEVEIEDLGDKGDGIARIDSGYVVFVPDTTLHERVTVEITQARETMAFAEVIGRQDRFD